MKKLSFMVAGILFLFLAGACSSQAGTKTWSAGTGDWFVDANWGR